MYQMLVQRKSSGFEQLELAQPGFTWLILFLSLAAVLGWVRLNVGYAGCFPKQISSPSRVNDGTTAGDHASLN